MTTVAFRDGLMASDSRITDGIGISRGEKLFRKKVGKRTCIIGICGDLYAAMLFVDWYGSDDKVLRDQLIQLDDDPFEVMIWDGKRLVTANRICRPIHVIEPYHAIGSGGPHAITAMDCGKTASQAIQFAARRDSNTGGQVVTMTLDQGTKHAPPGGGAASRPKSAR